MTKTQAIKRLDKAWHDVWEITRLMNNPAVTDEAKKVISAMVKMHTAITLLKEKK